MGFFKKLAKGLGIGVADVVLEIPAILSKDVWELNGIVTISAKSDLGKTEIGKSISMKTGENQNISFKVPILNPRFPPEPKQGFFSNSKPSQTSFKAKALVKFDGVMAEQEVSKTFQMA